MGEKPKVGFFSFTSCEGCQLVVLSMADRLLDLLGAVEVVNFREASSYKGNDYDVAVVEGAISTVHEIEELIEIRKQAKVLIAFGACAHIGGVNCMKNFDNQYEIKHMVYGDKASNFDSILAQPLDAVVKVDGYVRGCPPNREGEEFVEVVTALLQGKPPYIPNYPVCVQCKMKGNVCVFHKENPIACLGPVTRAGCMAPCPSFGNACIGCRGLVDDPNLNAHQETLEQAGLSTEEILKFYRFLNGMMEVGK
jgi:coenzyme F420-reducing hydrogenase gamma subunit